MDDMYFDNDTPYDPKIMEVKWFSTLDIVVCLSNVFIHIPAYRCFVNVVLKSVLNETRVKIPTQVIPTFNLTLFWNVSLDSH